MYKILIADDHAGIRQGLREALQDEFAGVEVSEAEDAAILISKVKSGDWDLVISDLVMPGGGGFAALKQIMKVKPDLPVIIISTYPAEQYASRVEQAGAREFISKDDLSTRLLVSVRNLLAASNLA